MFARVSLGVVLASESVVFSPSFDHFIVVVSSREGDRSCRVHLCCVSVVAWAVSLVPLVVDAALVIRLPNSLLPQFLGRVVVAAVVQLPSAHYAEAPNALGWTLRSVPATSDGQSKQRPAPGHRTRGKFPAPPPKQGPALSYRAQPTSSQSTLQPSAINHASTGNFGTLHRAGEPHQPVQERPPRQPPTHSPAAVQHCASLSLPRSEILPKPPDTARREFVVHASQSYHAPPLLFTRIGPRSLTTSSLFRMFPLLCV